METREHPRIMPGVEVFDADGQRVGRVSHLHEHDPAAASAAPGTPGDGVFEVKTGFLGIGKHYYIPFSAVKDVTVGGIFLTKAKPDFDAAGWRNKPQSVTRPDLMDRAVSPDRPDEIARPANASAASASMTQSAGMASTPSAGSEAGARPTGG